MKPFGVRLFVAAAIPLIGGCFSYVRVPIDGAPVGEEYRMLLTPQKMNQLRDLDEGGLPESGPPLLRGTLVERDATQLSLRIPIATRQVGFHQAEIDRQIRVLAADVVQLERRRLDRGRTALALAAAGAAAGGVVYAILNGSRLWDTNPDPPLPDALRWAEVLGVRRGYPDVQVIW